MHTHSISASILTTLKDFEIKMIHQNSLRFKGITCYDRDYNGLADSSSQEGQRVGILLKKQNAQVLLAAHHGVFTCGVKVHT